MNGFRFFDSAWQDLRYAVRTMLKAPVFSVAVVLTAALGIGVNTAMFSIISSILLKPLQGWEPDRLVLLTDGATPVRFAEMKATSQSYVEMGAFPVGLEDVTLSGMAEPEVLKGARVSANFLHILGVEPLRGRSFLAEEDRSGAPSVAMISANLWQQRFSRDPSIIGRTVTLSGMPHVIIGVLPEGFQFPISGADVWLTKPTEWPVLLPESRPRSPFLSVFGRLKPHVDIEHASAELAVLNSQYAAGHPEMLDAKRTAPELVRRYKDELLSDVRSKLWMLFGAGAFVLLIVCANIGGLLLARATSRGREFAVRAALGARRGRVMEQLLTESMLLASLGGALGILFAGSSSSLIRRVTFIDLPRAGEIRMDSTVLAFAVGLSVVTGVLFGLAPAVMMSKPDIVGVLKGSGEWVSTTSATRGLRVSLRGLLVVGQVAVSILLLIGAALLIESLAHLYGVDPGFQPTNLLTMSVALSPTHYDTDEKRAKYYEELVHRAEALPGVRSAAVTLTLPTTGFSGSPVQLAGVPPVNLDERPIAIFQNITPQYFRTLEIPLRRGREFSAHDNLHSVPVAIINESLARLFWPQYPSGPDPTGQKIMIGASLQAIEIVGISADVRQTGLDEDPKPGVYLPCAQTPPQSAMLALRTNGDPLSLANAMRRQALAVDRDQPVSAVSTMQDLLEASEGQLRLMMRLLGTFAGVAALLAIVGLYGMISYSVLQRTREIGIRSALGAPRSRILSLVVGQGLSLSLAGVMLGVCAAFVLTRSLQSWLFQISATDPLTFAGVSVLFLVVALVASYVPARRAMAINPLVALRQG